MLSPSSRRAWIEILQAVQVLTAQWSPSSRRAWIEMQKYFWKSILERKVALLAEGVDRNHNISSNAKTPYKSPSSRRAWIEIYEQ